jgi:hypothetical protein
MADASAAATGERHGLEEQRAERLARQRGELSIAVAGAQLLAKALRPLLRPEAGA